MKQLNEYSEKEQLALLAMTKVLVDSEPQPTNFSDLSETESLAPAERHTKQIQERRRKGQRGRVLLDLDEESAEIRQQVRTHLSKRGILSKNEPEK